eukprot:2239912-Heterocapsa_arctica.AAC.1
MLLADGELTPTRPSRLSQRDRFAAGSTGEGDDLGILPPCDDVLARQSPAGGVRDDLPWRRAGSWGNSLI